jgi:hypothetical protein
MEKCLERMATGGNRKVRSMIEEALDDVTIPEDAVVEATLEVRMPQDNLQAANIATALKQAGLVSDEWIQSKLLQIEQPEEMYEKIWSEQAAGAIVQAQIQTMVQQQMMKIQQQQMQMQQQVELQGQAQQQAMQPPQGMPPGGMM